MASRTIDAAELRNVILGSAEHALLDVREAQEFVANHILTASNTPLSRLEMAMPRLVPRRSTPVVLCDGGDDLAVRAAEVLEKLGYRDICTLQGGTRAWSHAGFVLFEGSNVPSKAFGEIVEIVCHTPALDAEEVKHRVDAGDNLVILDSRPWDEYRDFNIPGGIDCPNSELAYHVRDLVPDPETTIVVNCAGRTRSIIGCQTLVNAGVPNPVFALRNGTIGWEWAGLELERGADRRHGEASDVARNWAQSQCEKLAQRAGVKLIDCEALAAWRDEADEVSLYVFDVREPEEFAFGSLAGAISAQGTQLVQATDEYLAVREGRIVLVDDTGVRARMTASWLKQLGYPHVAVLEDDVRDLAELFVPGEQTSAACIAPQTACDDGWTLLDLSSSTTYRAGHPQGAFWGLRSRVGEMVAGLPAGRPVAILDDEHGHLAALAVSELARQGIEARVLSEGLSGWRQAGLVVSVGGEGMLSAMIDTPDMPFDLTGDPEAAKRAYIDWELQLPDQIKRDGLLTFEPLS